MDASATSDAVRRLLVDLETPRDAVPRHAIEVFRNWYFDAGHRQLAEPCPHLVFSRGDQNLDNVLWAGTDVRLVDFEDAGLSCRSYDLADLIEHISARGTPDASWLAFVNEHRDDCNELFEAARRLMAGWWLLALLPGGVGHHRNPAGSELQQAERLMQLLAGA